MKEFKENKEKLKVEIKDNKLVKWTPFPPEVDNFFNFSNIPPAVMNMKSYKIFPVIVFNIGSSWSNYIYRFPSS